jgi:mannose-6-phosphate isomerase-like protein (cupin superfamily)
MYAIPNAQREKSGLPGLEHVTLAGSGDGLSKLSVWRQSIAPGGATPPHRHDCEEVILVSGGRGELHIEGEVVSFDGDSTLIVPPNALHQVCNAGDTPLETTGIFSVSPVEVFLPDGTRIDLPWKS